MTTIEVEPEVEWWPSVPEDWSESSFGLDDAAADWQDQGLCGQADPEAWFPEKGGSTRLAKRTCAGCLVRARCLTYALENDERHGVWGGLSEYERRKLKGGEVVPLAAPRQAAPAVPDPPTRKVCTRCNTEKDRREFYRSSRPRGVASRCIDCTNELLRAKRRRAA